MKLDETLSISIKFKIRAFPYSSVQFMTIPCAISFTSKWELLCTEGKFVYVCNAYMRHFYSNNLLKNIRYKAKLYVYNYY